MAQSNGWFDVTQYGVELSSEDTHFSGIQNAIAAAKLVGGGNIWFPRGKYSLGSHRALELDQENITLSGEGSLSTIVITDPNKIPITISDSNVTIQDLSFVHDQGDVSGSWKPVPYTETILVVGVRARNIQLRGLHFENPTFGIKVLQVGGPVKIESISGQPLKKGIQIEDVRGKVHVDKVEFTPRWNSTSTVLNYQTGRLAVESHGLVAFKSVGNTVNMPSLVVFSNIMATQCRVGFLFEGEGIPVQNNTNQRIDTAKLYQSITGIQILGPTKRLDVGNYTFLGFGARSECAIHAYDDFGFLNGYFIKAYYCGTNAIRIDRSSSLAIFTNVHLEDWAQEGGADAAVESTSGTPVAVGRPHTFLQSAISTAPPTAPQIAGNVHLN
jgi:hypothetical protein